jgi:hypothetical protein
MERSKGSMGMRSIKTLEEIPRFDDEAAEAEYWATHSLAQIWDQLEPVRVGVSPQARRIVLRRSRKKTVTLRLEEQQIRSAKSLSYQALIRSWIAEGIERQEAARRHA